MTIGGPFRSASRWSETGLFAFTAFTHRTFRNRSNAPPMFEQAIDAASTAAEKKVASLETSLPRYLVLAILAGAYVGLGIALIFAIGAPLAAAGSPFTKVVMGASFGIALSLVVLAGAELFTGNAMVLPLGSFAGRTSWSQLASLWAWSYAGNLVGSIALAALLAGSGAFGADPQRSFVE